MPAFSDDELTKAGATAGGPPVAVTAASGRPARFAPGAIVAGRYRLVALLGRGGMGEVYRADDLTLDQPVALKFLPESVAAGDARLSQFHNELRIARQVSHKNVCRLYDLGEAEGRRFLTMEYVDGEDLASLLRRIGRIPQDKALDIARQLCAGVAAAHDRGVLHRDLKPANVMLDGEGMVRITDFGIATAAGEQSRDLVGTPQYMAPEQLDGRPASIASDIYALGLILFEVFTGRRAIDSKTLADLKDFHKSGTLTTPSSIVRDLDPAVERVILRCLSKDPDRRPASALGVAVALPGADPLAAALAAGETPSPEILASAGAVQALGVIPGLALVVMSVLGLVVFAAISARSSVPGRTPLELAPAVLVNRAEQISASLGYPSGSGDQAYSFARAADYLVWLARTRRNAQRYDPLAAGNPSGVWFWYRSSPRSLRPYVDAQVTLLDPPTNETDMRTVVLDPHGRLREFRSVTPQRDAGADAAGPPAWNKAFEAAGLELAAFTAVAPEWTPRDYADVRAAWEGPLGDPESIQVRVEAGAYRGRIVSFVVVGPWTQPSLMQPRQISAADRIINAGITIVICVLFVIAFLIARRNLRANRADRRGATRLAAFSAAVGFIGWLLSAHHSLAIQEEYQSLFRATSQMSLAAGLTWVIYVALEPYVRRLWPDSLLGWSRLMAGHFRDPRVGRDVLSGVAVGAAASLIDAGRATIIPWLGHVAPSPTYGLSVQALNGPGMMAATWTRGSATAIQAALMFVLLLVLVRLTLRRTWLTIPIAALILALPASAQGGTTNTGLVYLFPLATGILLTLLVFRSGLLAFGIAWLVWNVTSNVPMVQDWSHWSAAAGNWTLAALIALALFGFYAARGGQPLFGAILKD
jgi:serine/threonine-protein kinase